ncbi:type II secretion system F family protein [Corynebacterium poyangense]|uniref:type II secretion system F family protein n=1 Tax=Corynebacterium poyangense TaxID=2684405 RepID=UPI0021CD3B20|nr:type II secretion system F family protein [Corynebacterium poyangense]
MNSYYIACALLAAGLAVIIPLPPPRQRIHPDNWPRDGPKSRNWSWRWRRKKNTATSGLLLAGAADIDLFAACTRAGLSTANAAAIVAAAAGEDTKKYWSTIASLLEIGVSPDKAWAGMQDLPGLGELAGLSRTSHRSGAGVAEGCERIASNVRSETSSRATAAAERAGVFIALPLALCFLPAFLLLGLAPVVISLASSIF